MEVLLKSLPIILWAGLLETSVPCNAANILSIFPFPMRSHDILYKTLLEELVFRGHYITEITQYKSSGVRQNYRQIVVETKLKNIFDDTIDFHQIRKNTKLWSLGWNDLFEYWDLTYAVLDDIYKDEQVTQLLNSKTEKYDLIICEGYFGFESLFAFSRHFNAPVIAASSLGSTTYMNQHIGNPILSAVYPNFLLPYTDQMSLLQRFHNALLNLYVIAATHLYQIPIQEQLIDKYFTRGVFDKNSTARPSLVEMLKDVSLVFINKHPVLGYARPHTPNIIDIAGLHLKFKQQNNTSSNKNLQKQLDAATDGVIYFTFGSNVKVDKMPKEHRMAFIKAFSNVKQLVLWKWGNEIFPNKPKNVIIQKWFPQQEILAHKNCKAFITHGGMLSLEEAVYNAVPVIGIPFFGDQPMNMMKVQESGFGIMLDYENITEKSVSWALKEILYDSRYQKRADVVSSIFRDHQQSPLEKATYWVEYVLRHKGAEHLKSQARHLTWIQYLLLDVVLLVLILVAILLFSIKMVYKIIMNSIFSKRICNDGKSKLD